MIAARTATFFREAQGLYRCHPNRFRIRNVLPYFLDWRQKQLDGSTPLADEIPWITFAAKRFLDEYLRRDMSVFEYGSGGSTLYFAGRVAGVTTVEHDEAWAREVSDSARRRGYAHVSVAYVPADEPRGAAGAAPPLLDPSDPLTYSTQHPDFAGRTFRRYASYVDQYPDASFDVVVVDGRARPSCFLHGKPKVKPGGLMILDNADRDYYRYIPETLATEGWRLIDCSGPCPYIALFSRTCIWVRPMQSADR